MGGLSQEEERVRLNHSPKRVYGILLLFSVFGGVLGSGLEGYIMCMYYTWSHVSANVDLCNVDSITQYFKSN